MRQLGNYLFELSAPAVTTDSFRQDVAKKVARDRAVLPGLDRVIGISVCLVFGS